MIVLDYRGWKIPDILLSGNHANIERWHREQALERTCQRRPDLLPPDVGQAPFHTPNAMAPILLHEGETRLEKVSFSR